MQFPPRASRAASHGARISLIGLIAVAGSVLPACAQPRDRGAARSATVAVGPPVDVTLPEAVFIGLRNNRAIKSQYLQRVADKFALRVSENKFAPILNIAAGVSHQRSAGSTSTIGSFSPVVTMQAVTGATFSLGWLNTQTSIARGSRLGASQLSLQVIQPLLQGGGVDFATASIRIGRIQERNNQLQLKAVVVNTISQIILAYRALVQAQEQLKIAQESLKRSQSLLEVNRLLIAAGRLAAVELVQSQASIAQQEIGLATAQNTFAAAGLALLLQLALSPQTNLHAVDLLVATPLRVDPTRALQVAYDNQPAYLQQLLAVEVNRINLDVARNQRLWNVSAVGGTGATAANPNLADAVRALRSVKADFNIGLQVNIPIGDLHPEQGEVNANVVLRQSQLNQDQGRDQVQQQVSDATRTIDIQARQLELARRARELATEQLQIELVKLQVGRSSNFQVVAFQNELQLAENGELGAIVTYLNALTTFDQVLGTTLETWKISLNDGE